MFTSTCFYLQVGSDPIKRSATAGGGGWGVGGDEGDKK